MLTLPELGGLLNEPHRRDVLRLETLPRYRSASDGEDFQRFLDGEAAPTVDKSGWRDLLGNARARGCTWRRVRIVHDPITPYEAYSLAWGYPDSVRFGEQVRVRQSPPGKAVDQQVGDFFVLDGQDVIRSVYDADGWFQHAEPVTGPMRDVYVALAGLAWDTAEDFTTWWSRHHGEAQVA